ncbi:MAG TPA: TatD family hydrolase [Burkholderiales bacterium]
MNTLVDSHCHLDLPELIEDLDRVLQLMRENAVAHALCVCVTLEAFPNVLRIAKAHRHLYASVGVHPDSTDVREPTVEELIALSTQDKVIALGETGLDYYRLKGDLEWQRDRFRAHIRAARAARKPLIIHTRSAADDTLRVMREENAGEAGGVMHCFTESWDVAAAALDLGFYISFSGIVTFKNASIIREVAQKVPIERMLVETDAPYLAPVPHRGKLNQPGYVRHTAEAIAQLRDISVDELAAQTSANFFRLFKLPDEARRA